jgi:hypothetical protein
MSAIVCTTVFASVDHLVPLRHPSIGNAAKAVKQ